MTKEQRRYSTFESELVVRPDDIDMNNHVHMSRYLDYVLFARHDQMGRCYGLPMSKFIENGWGWYVRSCQIEFKRPLFLNETAIVRTWLESFERSDALFRFQVFNKQTMKVAAEGVFLNTMIILKTGRAVQIPDWVVAQYAQFVE